MTVQVPPRLLTLTAANVSAAALLSPLALTSHAQNAQRGAIQTPWGGRGPGAAPDTNDPPNANADLSPKPPVLPLAPEEEAKRLAPSRYRMSPCSRIRSSRTLRRLRSMATAGCSSSSCVDISRRRSGRRFHARAVPRGIAPGQRASRLRDQVPAARRRRRTQFPGLDDRRTATGGDVVPDRAAGAAGVG
jgi:hypothetical protein